MHKTMQMSADQRVCVCMCVCAAVSQSFCEDIEQKRKILPWHATKVSLVVCKYMCVHIDSRLQF